MPDFHDLMFEVSNEERVRILKAVKDSKSSFSGLSRALGITTQEVSRHFNRLMEAGLTSRDNDGHPCLTPYGRLILKELEAAEFTSENREYFISHLADDVPDEYISRLGELSGLQFQDNVMLSIHNIIRILQEAEEYVLNINVPFIAPAFPHIRKAYEMGVKGFFLHGESLTLPAEMRDIRDEVFTDDFIAEMRRRDIYWERFHEVGLVMYMNENEVALLSLPKEEGGHDFIGFTGVDPVAHQWCKSLFYHFWEKATPVN